MLETVGQSLHHSCRSRTYLTRNFATLGPSELQPPFTGAYIKAITFLFTLQHRAGVRPYTSFYKLAETCVFIKQSLSSILCQLLITYKSHSFSRSYGVILPSSLNIIISSALVYSTCPPVSV